MNTIDINNEEQLFERTPKVIKFFQKIIGDNVNEIIDNISFEEFKNYLIRINGLILDIPIKDRKLSESVQINASNVLAGSEVSYLPPKNKEGRLLELYSYIKKIKSKKEKAEFLYYGIQLIHPFADGNGRTGRFLYNLIINDFNLSNSKKYYKNLDNSIGREDFENILPSNMKLVEFLHYNLIVNLYKLKGFYSGIMGHDNIIEKSLENNKNINKDNSNFFLEASILLKSALYHNFYSYTNFILYKINDNKKYTKVQEKEKNISYSGKEIVENLTKEDCLFIINEFEKFQNDLLKELFYEEGVLKYFIENY